jgi:hypothetical protein
MATNPRSKTPNDAALSAVEEALRLDFGGPGEDSERAPRRPPEPRAPESRSAADAVRRSEMGRRPETSRLPAPRAALSRRVRAPPARKRRLAAPSPLRPPARVLRRKRPRPSRSPPVRALPERAAASPPTMTVVPPA